MNRRYALARLGATLEQLPELANRLTLLGERFETLRASQPTEAQRAAAAAFDQRFGEAAGMMLAYDEQTTVVPPAELIALEEAIRRVEAALAAYIDLGRAPSASPRAPSRSSGASAFFLGALLIGGVVFWTRSRF